MQRAVSRDVEGCGDVGEGIFASVVRDELAAGQSPSSPRSAELAHPRTVPQDADGSSARYLVVQPERRPPPQPLSEAPPQASRPTGLQAPCWAQPGLVLSPTTEQTPVQPGPAAGVPFLQRRGHRRRSRISSATSATKASSSGPCHSPRSGISIAINSTIATNVHQLVP